jgi:hypothetical protein
MSTYHSLQNQPSLCHVSYTTRTSAARILYLKEQTYTISDTICDIVEPLQVQVSHLMIWQVPFARQVCKHLDIPPLWLLAMLMTDLVLICCSFCWVPYVYTQSFLKVEWSKLAGKLVITGALRWSCIPQ